MTAEKTKNTGGEVSAYGLTKESQENPFVNPGRNRASSDQSDTGTDTSRRRPTADGGELATLVEGRE